MPRTGKGGRRAGADQTAYANRTDLNNRGPEPITVAPGEPFGQRQMLEDAQRAVPMAGTQIPDVTIAPATPAGMAQAAQATNTPAPEPGTLPWTEPMPHPQLNEPFKNPNFPAVAESRVSDILQAAAASPYATNTVKELAAIAKIVGA